jgi:hypothetical protein
VLRRARKRWPGWGRHGIPTSGTGASTSIPVFSRPATLPRNSPHPFRTSTARHGKVVGLPTAQSDRASPSLGQRQTNRLCIKQSLSCTAPTLSPLCSGFALQVGSRSLSTEKFPWRQLTARRKSYREGIAPCYKRLPSAKNLIQLAPKCIYQLRGRFLCLCSSPHQPAAALLCMQMSKCHSPTLPPPANSFSDGTHPVLPTKKTALESTMSSLPSPWRTTRLLFNPRSQCRLFGQSTRKPK